MSAALGLQDRPLPVVPKVSVIVPTYNSSGTITEALDGIIAQRHPNLEILVIDDGSRDDTVSLVRSQYPQAHVFQQPNSGAAAARNRGLREARGDLIAFLDADDVWFEGKLAAQIQAMHRHPELGFTFTSWWVGERVPNWSSPEMREETARWPGVDDTDTKLSGWLYTALLCDVVIHTSTLVMRRELAEATGYFNVDLRRGQDWEYWLRMSRHAPGLKLSRPCSLYRQHASSAIRQPQPRNYGHEILSGALSKWGTHGPDGSTVEAALLRAALSRSCRDFAHLHAHHGSARIAIRYAMRAMIEDPRDSANAWAAFKIAFRAALRAATERDSSTSTRVVT